MKKILIIADHLDSALLYKILSYLYLEIKRAKLRLLANKNNVSCFLGFPKKQSFCFLGSGSSILELTDADYSKLKSKITVGPNAWMFHNFIPDFYTIEGRSGNVPDAYLVEFCARLKILSSNAKKFTVLIHVSAINSIKPLMECAGEDASFYLYDHVKPITLKSDRLDRVVTLMSNIVNKPRYSGIAIGKGATLERIASLIKSAEFTDFGLLGVDLKDQKTFYDADHDLLKRLSVSSPDERDGIPHKTNDSRFKRFTVIEMLNAFFQNATDFGKVYVASPRSALANYFRVSSVK